ncbi:MAG: hypothetical protein BRD50_01690 [Bacteroidetes bacterium SW_11_45_7]|nr:MAG: hypothetical protein BRD50_01690 [Bacteroidetes bacterium SW_11_45_7]
MSLILHSYFERTLFLRPVFLLRLASFFVLMGRGWQFIRWDAPLRTLFRDQYLMEPVVKYLTGRDWQTYATNLHIDQAILYIEYGIGGFFIFTAIASLIIEHRHAWLHYALYTASGLLFLSTLLYWKEQAFSIGRLLELTIQWTTPLFLVLYVQKEGVSERLLFFMKVAVAATFVGHGLYAFGYYPVPGSFVQMMITVFGVDENVSMTLLKIAGILDFALSAGIFLPWRSIVTISLGYAFGWGLVTALARIISHFYRAIPLHSIEQWGHETVFRLPHALIPLIILIIVSSRKN